MTLRLNGSTSGYTEIDAPASAGNNTLLLPTGNGSNGNILGTDGAGNLSWVNGRMVLETVKASTSGTVVDFTGIPSWVRRVTVLFVGVSSSGSSHKLIQLGTTSGFTSTGYTSTFGNGGSMFTATTGFGIYTQAATDTASGAISILNVTGNTWVASGVLKINTGNTNQTGGDVALASALTQLRITTVNGTDTFDAGSINILYEG